MPWWFWLALPGVLLGAPVLGIVLATYTMRLAERHCPKGLDRLVLWTDWLMRYFDRLPGLRS